MFRLCAPSDKIESPSLPPQAPSVHSSRWKVALLGGSGLLIALVALGLGGLYVAQAHQMVHLLPGLNSISQPLFWSGVGLLGIGGVITLAISCVKGCTKKAQKTEDVPSKPPETTKTLEQYLRLEEAKAKPRKLTDLPDTKEDRAVCLAAAEELKSANNVFMVKRVGGKKPHLWAVINKKGTIYYICKAGKAERDIQRLENRLYKFGLGLVDSNP